MGWEKRGQKRYYVRKKRVNGRVVSEYVGSGEVGRLAELVDEQAREERRQAKERERAQKAQLKQIDDAISQFSDEIKQLVGQVLQANGYHQHKGQWRKRRMTDIEPRKNLAGHRFVKPVMQQATMARMIKAVVAPDDEESPKYIKRQINEMREALGYETATPLEALLIEQIAVLWLRSQIAISVFAAHLKNDNTSAMKFFDAHVQKSNAAFLKTCESLAKIQKMTRRDPSLQINIAHQQVNQLN